MKDTSYKKSIKSKKKIFITISNLIPYKYSTYGVYVENNLILLFMHWQVSAMFWQGAGLPILIVMQVEGSMQPL